MPYLHIFEHSQDSDSTTPLGCLFQFLSTLSKEILLMSNINCPWCHLYEMNDLCFPQFQDPLCRKVTQLNNPCAYLGFGCLWL